MNPHIIARIRRLIETESEEYSKKEWKHLIASESSIYNYRYNHVQSVVSTARYIAELVGADTEIVTLAAWMHDIAKPGLGGTDDHGERSAKIAENLLIEAGIESKKIKCITDAIRWHVGIVLTKPLPTIEAQILWESDKLVKLGSVGIIHYIINGIQLEPGISLSGLAQKLREFVKLAERIAASMVTTPGKRLAKRRLEILRQFSLSLLDEISLYEESR